MSVRSHRYEITYVVLRGIMEQHFIPRDATIAEPERKAAAAEEKAINEAEPRAAELREEAKLYREWAASLRSGR